MAEGNPISCLPFKSDHSLTNKASIDVIRRIRRITHDINHTLTGTIDQLYKNVPIQVAVASKFSTATKPLLNVHGLSDI
jgi:hypothetical protein